MADFDYSGYDFANDPNAVAKATYARLQSLGVAPQTAAGALGSLMGESGSRLNTSAINKGDGADGSNSIGMGQWNADRAIALQNRAQQMGTKVEDPRAQIEHIAGELTGTHKHVLAALKEAGDDLGKGTDIWTRQYEVPGDPDATMYKRASNGLNFYNNVGRLMDPATTGSINTVKPPARPADTSVSEDGAAAPAGAIFNRNPMAQQAVANSPAQLGPAEQPGGGILSPSFWSGKGGGFAGINNISDLGNRLEKVGGWLNPAAAAGAASIQGAQTSALTAASNIEAQKFNQARATKKDAQEEADKNNPETTVSTAPSGKALLVTRKKPNGDISVDTIPLTSDAIKDDGEGKTAKGEKPAPASILKLENDHKKGFSSSVDLVDNIDDVVKAITTGKVSMDAVSQGLGYLKNHTDSADYNAQILKKAKSAIMQLAQQRVKLEGGSPSDFRIKQAEASILPSGGEYDTTQVLEALVRARRVLTGNLRDSASGLGSIYTQHPSLGKAIMPGSTSGTGEFYLHRYGDITKDDENYYKSAEDFVKKRNTTNSTKGRPDMNRAMPGLF
ncbi:phage tail tip lysozyme [Methylobacterium sp. HMF5984]|uniref:phage tail tip lysozyme n=1 Tax=Methylobacterium sp. HMF5984 TaxID=3367370 RepID=UPI0038548425